MVTVRHLAKLAGVSASTVSRALRHDPQIGVTTRQRIQELAKEFHFQPNRLAEGMFTGTSHVVGFLIPEVDNSNYSLMMRGALDEAYHNAYQILLYEGHGDVHLTQTGLSSFVQQRVDGVLCLTRHPEPIPREALIELISNNIVPVGIDQYLQELPIDHVHCDEALSARLAVEYLLELGHRCIGFVGTKHHGQLYGRALEMENALRWHGLSFASYYEAPPGPQIPLHADAVFAQFLRQHPRPTALIGWDDLIAVRLVQRAPYHHIDVPRQLSIIGCGNYAIADVTTPPLTSIEQQPEEVGRAAMRLLLRRLREEPTAGAPPESITIPAQIVKRSSCTKAPAV